MVVMKVIRIDCQKVGGSKLLMDCLFVEMKVLLKV